MPAQRPSSLNLENFEDFLVKNLATFESSRSKYSKFTDETEETEEEGTKQSSLTTFTSNSQYVDVRDTDLLHVFTPKRPRISVITSNNTTIPDVVISRASSGFTVYKLRPKIKYLNYVFI